MATITTPSFITDRKKISNMKNINWIWIIALLWFASCNKSDYKPGPVEIPELPGTTTEDLVLEVVDNDIEAFMTRYNVPGLSLAITKDGKLVYAKGYGFADREAGLKVDTGSQFRLASLSKWITSTTIMKLIEQGRLGFNDKVFGTGAVLGTNFGTAPYPGNVTQITVEQLLHHTGGGWGNSSNDPMFANPTYSQAQLLGWILNDRPLSNTPGTVSDYSNAGFFILGMIIEKITGKTYQQYVTDSILKPMGIANMSFANTSLAGRKPKEVKYYGTGPYNYAEGVIPRIGGAGAWLASPIDMMRFLVRVDGFNTVPDILDASALNIMSSKTTASGNYACGFLVSTTGNWYHGGTYNGTRNWMVRTTKGFNWVILINTSATGNFNTDLDKLVWPAVNNSSTAWPDKNYF